MEIKHTITNTTRSDLEFICHLFDKAIEYQRQNNYPSWIGYDRAVILNDMDSRQQYKLMIDGEIAIFFTVLDADPLIWREHDKGDAIYLHRIVVNPKYKGRKLFGSILNWAIIHAHERGLKYVRMDTFGENLNMIDYYKSFGFQFVEYYTTEDTPELPPQNRNIYLILLEMKTEDGLRMRS